MTKGYALLLTPDAFRAYCIAHQHEAAIGERSSCATCPLAVFLTHHGAEEAEVGNEVVEIRWNDTTEELFGTPLWALRFMDAVDSADDLWSAVTAGEAVSILDTLNQGDKS